jgi:outer membrane biosynthesis protein TonB
MVFKVTNSLTNSTKTEQNQDSLIRYLEEEHNRASNLNYTANIHISNIDKKNQIISEISCELPFPSKQEIALFVSDFVSSSGDNQKSKKINLPFFKGSTPTADPVAPTETPKPTEPTPTVDPVTPTETPKITKPTTPAPTADPVAPTETPTPADAPPKKTGTYKAPATQPKNTNRSKLYKGISAVVLGFTVCLLSINSVALLSTQKKLANTIDKVEKQSEALEKSGDNSTDVFSRYFISNYLRDAKTANDFSDNEKLEKNGLSTPSSASSIMLFSKEKKGDKYLMTYVVTYTVDTNTFTNKMSFEIKKSDKAKFGYLVTSDKITLSDYTK